MTIDWKEALWARFFTGAPRQLRQSVELGAMLLAHLLTQQGFRPRLMRMPDISGAQLQGDAVAGVKMVCISLFDIENRYAFLKFLMRRLARIFPSVPHLDAFWKFDPNDTRQADIITKAGLVERVGTLADAVALCLARASGPAPSRTCLGGCNTGRGAVMARL